MSLEFSSSDDSAGLESIVAALDDDACRRIIAVLEEPLTADEIAEKAEIPLSSTYKKLDRLADADLVTEANGIRQGPNAKSRYVANFDRIAINLGDDRTLRVDIDREKRTSLDLFSDVEQEF
ncbi:transcriptional regulator [Halopiger aswanensis]|uniref:Helix-turn-helix protein n=1 Tax=Halopiger aswanensis TaxID=148449 RepID=A0A3R7E0S0_9EURY|nr:transcriptional regulator [Halopiger aswanensis]RKD97236.1 helix-turn-helix protein [Halopiger aswanensis]